MFINVKTLNIAALFWVVIPQLSIAAQQVIPCAVGSGKENGCSYCDKGAAIEVAPWNTAKIKPDFNVPEAASQIGGGYNVWWNIYQPDPGCRVILFDPYNTDKGNIDSALSGNVVLSVSQAGCYFAHVGSAGIAAGFCCGTGDCTKAGAIGSSKKRSLPLSRIARSIQSKQIRQPEQIEQPTSNIISRSKGCVVAREWQNENPYNDENEESPERLVTCTKAKPEGDAYTKAGKQQIGGQELYCNGGESCSQSPSISVAVSESLTNEKSTTITTTNGCSLSVSAGLMFIGPTTSMTLGLDRSISEAFSESFSESLTETVTKTITLSIGLTPGAKFKVWFTPTMKCQRYNLTCNDADHIIEKCSPQVDGQGNPVGQHGVMTVG